MYHRQFNCIFGSNQRNCGDDGDKEIKLMSNQRLHKNMGCTVKADVWAEQTKDSGLILHFKLPIAPHSKHASDGDEFLVEQYAKTARASTLDEFKRLVNHHPL